MSEQKPSVGRIVHYSAFAANGVECVPAIITRVDYAEENRVSLCIFDPRGIQMHSACEHDELPPTDKITPGERSTHRGHSWHWPERV